MNNIKVLIISLLTICLIIFIGIKISNALYDNDNEESKILLTYFDNDTIDISNFNDKDIIEYTFAISNLTSDYLKYTLVWTDVINNIDTIENINNITYSLSTCNLDYTVCDNLITNNTILPATTNNTLAAIPNVINKCIEENKTIYYKLSIKSSNNINKSFKGNIKLLNED